MQQLSLDFGLSVFRPMMTAWYLTPKCPGCGKQLSVGITSHWAGCPCGFWWDGVKEEWHKAA